MCFAPIIWPSSTPEARLSLYDVQRQRVRCNDGVELSDRSTTGFELGHELPVQLEPRRGGGAIHQKNNMSPSACDSWPLPAVGLLKSIGLSISASKYTISVS